MNTKEAETTPTYVHGPTGILSMPGQGKRKKKKVINAMITPKEVKDRYLSEKDTWDASRASWDVESASYAISNLTSLLRSEAYQEESDDTRQILDIIRNLASFLSGEVDEIYSALVKSPTVYKEAKAQFITTKEGDTYRWTMITGSAFQDRDQEIISEKAFENDCDQMELTGDYGELLWWHCDGTQHATDKEARPYIPLGSCDTSLVYEKLNIESGLYYDPEVGQLFTEKASEFGASKSFWHKEDEPVDGVYSYIRTKERSILPRTKEANLLTRLFGQKEKEMADNKERIAALKEKLGEEQTNKLLEQGKDLSAKADKFLASKEAADKKEDKKEDDNKDKKEEAKPEMKEADGLLLAIKEAQDTFSKEMKDSFAQVTKEFTDYKTATEAKNKETAENIAQLQGAVSTLLGFQPKSNNKFQASKEGNEANLSDAQKDLVKKVKEAEGKKDGLMEVVDFLMAPSNAPAA